MPEQKNVGSPLKFFAVTPRRWSDFETLFGERGACGGCWCMLWRLKRSEFEQHKGEKNKQAMKAIIESGKIPGILAYSKGQPIAWCSVLYKTGLGFRVRGSNAEFGMWNAEKINELKN